MAGLLVSVRSPEEALAAVAGGASVIDVKEPGRGPLGRSDPDTWRAIRAVVPRSIPVSVALGEIGEFEGVPPGSFEGIAFRKLGLAGAGDGWIGRWAAIRRAHPGPTAWVAVAYADWQAARAPAPDEVLGAALEAPGCAGVLVDTWDKTRPAWQDGPEPWAGWIARARAGGRFVALAGGLDLASIARLAPLRPDLFAVRGAACLGSDRLGRVDRDRVAVLVLGAARVPEIAGPASRRPG